MLSLNHFAKATHASLFEVFEVYDNASHPVHEHLLNDLDNISGDHLSEFLTKGIYRFQIDENRPDDIQRRLYCFVELVNKEISKLRILHLLNSPTEIPAPYKHPAIIDLKRDNNNLVKAADFEYIRGGFMRENEAFTLLLSLDTTNSCYWLLSELFEIENPSLIKIRLDPLIHHPIENFNPMEFKMQVYGKALEWERIKNLNSIEHTQFIPDGYSRHTERTDLVWKPVDDEIHFTCEEMPQSDSLEVRGSRYFHAIFERSTGIVKHCDGAVRFYSQPEYESRMANHIKSNQVTRVGKRVKIFQIDVPKELVSDNPITHQLLINLITSFYVWNKDVFTYFNS